MRAPLGSIAVVLLVQAGCLLSASPPTLTGNGACVEQGCDPAHKCNDYGDCEDYCYDNSDCRSGFQCVDDYESDYYTRCAMFCDVADDCLDGWTCARSDMRSDVCVQD